MKARFETRRHPQLFRLLCLCILLPLARSTFAVEGMFPMSELERLNLRKEGFQIDAREIYNPEGLSLVDGVCKLGGCTGSLVTANGLILTNHHCAFRALQAASSADNDYLSNGFYAESLKDEIWAKGYTVRITESYQDVSARVLSAASAQLEPAARTKAIERRKKELEVETEAKNPGKRAEVADMFPGKTYVLFLYTDLRDVRLVFAPPRAIGEYGGEKDNWIWPRHTGDFSFMRAYVGPDGQPADYSPENVPYHPRKLIQVAPEGAEEGDLVFLFGYPGRTFRHQTSYFLDFEANVRMPYVVDWYGWQINVMEKLSVADPAAKLRLSSRLGRLWNTYKNYRGKLQGVHRLDLVEKRRAQEELLQRFIDTDGKRKQTYGTDLEEIAAVYARSSESAPFDLWIHYLTNSPDILDFAITAYDAAHEKQKSEVERESRYQERNWKQTVRRLQLRAAQYDEATDRAILTELLRRGGSVPRAHELPGVGSLVGPENSDAAARYLDNAFGSSHIHEIDALNQALEASPEELKRMDDPFLQLAIALYPTFLELREEDKATKGQLDQLQSRLLDVQGEFLGTNFVPDANGTLRFTYGHVRGYSPRDGVRYLPHTTLGGVLEKNTGAEPYAVPSRLSQLYEQRDFGTYYSQELGDVPACILYSADTSGGSSGSPVFDARGRLVGLNFDRAWEATINDFDWDESYSRSIGVDIRYILFLTSKYGGAGRLLKEMGLTTKAN